MIRRALDRGQLDRIGPRTFSVAGAPATWRMSLQAALLDLGANAAVAGRSAAALLGFDNFAEGPVELLVPRRERMHQAIAVVRSTSRPPSARRDRGARRVPVHQCGAHHHRPGRAREPEAARGRHRQRPARGPDLVALPPSASCGAAAPGPAGDGAPRRPARGQWRDHPARAPVPAAGAPRRAPSTSLPDDASSRRQLRRPRRLHVGGPARHRRGRGPGAPRQPPGAPARRAASQRAPARSAGSC